MTEQNYNMLRAKSIGAALAALLAVVCSCGKPAAAQSTLFNIPSTDVVGKKKLYVEFDFISHLEPHDEGGFQSYIPRVVVGLGGDVEVGANVAFTDALAPDQPVERQPNVKWKFTRTRTTACRPPRAASSTRRSRTARARHLRAALHDRQQEGEGSYGPRRRAAATSCRAGNGKGSEGGAIAGYGSLALEGQLRRRLAERKNRFGYVTPASPS